MNKTELQQKIVDMEKQLAELKKELEKKDKGMWKPEECEDYYFIDSDSEIMCEENTSDNVDFNRFDFVNYYKTEEEAQKMSNYLKYTNLLRKYVEEHSEPLDWGTAQLKFHLYYDFNDKEIKCWGSTSAKSQGIIHASSEQVLKDAISFLGEENIKRHIFCIEE